MIYILLAFGLLFFLSLTWIVSGPLKPGNRSLSNQVMFKLSQCSENLKDQAATRTSGVDGFRKGFEANSPRKTCKRGYGQVLKSLK
jgi:hypothetical protein